MIGISPDAIVGSGLIAIALVVFAESGLMIGFFLPGDSLLFTAGFLASQEILDVHQLVLVVFVAAVIGDAVGYTVGHKMGPRLRKRPDGRFFKQKYITQSEKFYEIHGKKAIVIARFTPIVRTFAPIVAGLGKMHYRTFAIYNVVGAALWSTTICYAGFWLGKSIPGVEKLLEPMIIFVILLSLSPAMYHYLKVEQNRKTLLQLPSRILRNVAGIFRK